MKRMYKRIITGLLISALLLSGCTPSKPINDEHVDVSLSELVYERPDMEALSQKIDTLEKEIETQSDNKDVITRYQDILNEARSFETMQNLIYFQFNKDVTNQQNATELELLTNYYTELDNELLSLTKIFLESSYKEDFIQTMGEDFVERYEINSKMNSPEIEELKKQETAYIQEYNIAIVENYTTIYNGKEVTFDDIDYNDPNASTPYDEIIEKRNASCGEIYLKLVKVRHEIAEKLNYDNYAEYAYDARGYGFELEDAKKFQENVLNELAPVYNELELRNQKMYEEIEEVGGATVEQAIPVLKKALEKEFSKSMQETLAHMTRNELYYFDDSQNISMGAYTGYLADYLAPYIFINTSSYDEASTFFHEFGHFINLYNYPSMTWGDVADLNLVEVHSQGMELLMHPYYDQIFSKETIEYQQGSNIINIMYSVLLGCVEDEFQQRIYENPEMTLNEANLLHGEIHEKYFGYPEYYDWIRINQHYNTPMYYISYATSAVSALEIYLIANEDRTKALKIYEDLTQFTQNSSYLEALKSTGLRNPFEDELIKEIATFLSKE